MEYLAKILEETKVENSNLWKYTFLDIQTNQEDLFYHKEQINYEPNITGKLELTRDKFFKSFNQEIIESEEKIKQDEILTELEGEVNYGTKKFSNDLPRKRIKLSLDSQHSHRLHKKGYTWKEVTIIYEIYYWLKTNGKVLKKRGTKSRITDEVASLVRSYTLENKTKTQQEISEHVFKELGVVLSQPSICVLLKKLGITRKKLTYHYTLLDEKKRKPKHSPKKPNPC